MKKRLSIIVVIAFVLNLYSISVFAGGGEMGYFGGISEGTNLPKTIEKYVEKVPVKTLQLQYKEIIYISEEPVEFEGIIKITIDDDVISKDDTGSYTEKYEVKAINTDKNATLDRKIQFETSYRIIEGEFKKQIIRDSAVTNWDEDIEIDGIEYTLNEAFSTYSKSSVEDITPGVSYYNTSISYDAEYTASNNEKIIINTYGNMYGYDQPWSKVETQKLTMNILGDDWQMEVELNPSMEAKKTIYYDEADPYPISFDGTYNQRMERESSLKYKINTYHPQLTNEQKENSILVTSANEIEKLLIAENLDFLIGHWAEEDMKKLYSMEIFTELPHNGMQFEAMPRGEYVKALCLAMNIDTSKYEDEKNTLPQVFGDVTPENPLYPYIMATYDAKLIKGTGENFAIDVPITREDAFVIYIRVIGLERLGVTGTPTTPFVDDLDISSWAKKEIFAGYNLGIIKGDHEGRVMPKQWISKAEAAAIINRLIGYLREDIAEDYRNLL